MKTHSYAPDAYIAFFPFQQEDTGAPIANGDEAKTNTIIVKDEILSIETYKPKTGMGNWEVSLTSTRDFKNLIAPGNWCLIYMSDNQLSTKPDTSEDSGLKMVGIVKSVRKNESVDAGTGIKTIRYRISGIDFHSILNVQVYINATLRTLGEGAPQQLIDALILLGNEFESTVMKPQQIVAALIKSILGDSNITYTDPKTGKKITRNVGARAGMPYLIPPDVASRIVGSPAPDNRFVNFMSQNFQQNLIGEVGLQPEIGSQFTLWSILETYAHRILNEIYTDLMPIKTTNGYQLVPTFVMRAIPFNSKARPHESCNSVLDGTGARTDDDITPNQDQSTPKKGIHLYTSRFIPEDEILGLDYGKSDQERFNFFLVVPNQVSHIPFSEAAIIGKLLGQKGGINNLADVKSVSRYGLRPYITGSPYMVPYTSDKFDTPINSIVQDMWSSAHRYDNGTVAIKGPKHHIPVGTNIVFLDRAWVAHVEGVGYSFGIDGRGGKFYRSTINFTRLQTAAGEPLGPLTDGDGQDWERGSSSSNGDNQ